MASNALLAAAGLVTSPNQLNTQEGALTEASNIVIRRDGIIEQRRGMSVYGDYLPLEEDRVKQITSYRERIIRHYNNKLQFDSTGSGRFLDILGNVTEVDPDLRLKFIESNGNLYFTTIEGIKKLSAKDTDQLPIATIENAGIETGLDIQGNAQIIDNLQSGFLPQDSKVGYRVVWCKEDRNTNLLLGAPSQKEIVTLSMNDLIIRDVMRLLEQLDSLDNLDSSTARISDKNYVEKLKLTLSSSTSQLRANLINLAKKLDNDIVLAKSSTIDAAPFQIDSAKLENGIATITFKKIEVADLTALNALSSGVKNAYTIYKTLDTNNLYYWDGTSFQQKDRLSEYFSNGLNINLSGFNLNPAQEIQTINFSRIADSGVFSIKYKGNESETVPLTATNEDIKNAISKVAGLELISSVTGSFSTGFTLTFSNLSGNLDQITVGGTTTIQKSFYEDAIDGAKFGTSVTGGLVSKITRQSDGKILVSGQFTNYGGTIGRNNLIRLNSDGTLDTEFCINAADGSKFNNSILTINVQSDGKILVGGSFSSYDGFTSRKHLIRLNSDGTLDSTFSTTITGRFNEPVNIIRIQEDGSILVGGNFTTNTVPSYRYLVRLFSDGTVDTSFCDNASTSSKFTNTYSLYDIIKTIEIQSDGKILVGGNFSNYEGTVGRNNLIRLNSDGTLDTAFCTNASDGSNFDNYINIVKVQPNGQVLVGGYFNSYLLLNRSKFIRLNSDGTIDSTFCFYSSDGGKFSGPVEDIEILSNGSIIVCGAFTDYAGTVGRNNLLKFGFNGILDTTFCNNASDSNKFAYGSSVGLYDIEIDSNDRIFVCGYFENYGDIIGRNKMVILQSSGQIDVFNSPVIVSTSTTQNGIIATSGDLNQKQIVSSVGENTITFLTDAVGFINLSTDAQVTYNEFRSITEPSEPSVPALNSDLQSIQDYFNAILQKLQDASNVIIAEYPTLSYPTLLSFPIFGSFKITYKALDTNKTYIWNGSNYIEGTDDKEKFYKINSTTSANVELTFTIPDRITTDNFYQVYRSSVSQAIDVANIDDLVVSDEMKLVYEAYPTSEEILQKSITILDQTPEVFRGANLYTNATTGEGILQSNYPPPLAKDINRYRNTIFYANTRTKNKLELNLLPIENLIQNYDELNKPKLTITNGIKTNTYTFIIGKKEVVEIIVNNTSLAGKSFKLSSTRGKNYRVFFDSISDLEPDEIGLKISTDPTMTESEIAVLITSKLSLLLDDFIITYDESIPNKILVTNVSYGVSNDSTDVDTGFSVSVIEQGSGEDNSDLNVLLSSQPSIAQAVDETAKSLIEIINKNQNESVYAFYLSAEDDVPGQMYLESKYLEDENPFYISTNNTILGASFNPDITPENTITNISTISAKTTITTTLNHQLITGDQVIISGSNTIPSVDGIHTITKVNNNQFTISQIISSSGTTGSIIKKDFALSSENEIKINRVYYSKYGEPEAVPIVNYIDLGSSDKKIIRILPLRDSLFVFKEDGLFRISGDSPSFQSELFDNSYILLAPDSLAVCNNIIYGWTTQGIQALTEGGATVISRNIDNLILKTQSSNYVNFKTATWGIGYESDNAYLVFTVKNTGDEVAQIAYRYSTLTNTWTTYDKSYSCGHIANFDDHFYAGATDIANIEKERKTFSRLDYCDREYEIVLSSLSISKNKIKLSSVSNFQVGDVLVQEQPISQYEFNQLLKKLDLDAGLSDNNYFEEIAIVTEQEATLNQLLIPNINLRQSLIKLAMKLDSDANVIYNNFFNSINSKTGSITEISIADETIITCSVEHGLIDGRIVQITGTNSSQTIDGIHKITVIDSFKFKINIPVSIEGTAGIWGTVDSNFEDLKVCYNYIIDNLNNDENVNFSNYRQITTKTIQEAVIIDINKIKKELTLNIQLPYLEGEAKIYKSISCNFTYSPNTFGDPLSLKHLRESTLMLETRTLTSGILSFSTDLLPEFVKINFNLEGNGIFGHQNFGNNFFGGLSNSAPFRTYIPRQCQRCRYIICRFTHSVAREDWRVLGMTLTGEVSQSTRAFR